jgi:uncharacterized heparinase superfamily protein
LLAISKWGAPFKLRQIAFEDMWPGDSQQGQRIYGGQFIFLGEEVNTETHLFWRHPGVSATFLSQLHEFEWLRDLRALSLTQARGMARRYIADWIITNQTWHPTIWSPEVAGRRLASWIGLFDFFGSSADEEFLRLFRKSVSHHMRYLEGLNRFDQPVQGMLPILKGLIVAKLSIGHSIAPLLRDLEVFLNNQMYADGFCKNLTPLGQLMVLRDLLDVKQALKKMLVSLPQGFQSHLEKLAMVIRFFRHGDGRLALFHNSIEGVARQIDTILSQTSVKGGGPTDNLEEGGFYRAPQGKGLLIFETGSPLATQRLHDDRLGFEYSYGAQRLICNGTHPLQPLTGAHEGAETSFLSGTALFFNQADRVILESESISVCDGNVWTLIDDACSIITAEWEQRVSGLRLQHQRSLTLMNEGRELRGQERFLGHPQGAALLRLTFHPKLKATFRKDSAHIILTSPEGQKWCLKADRFVDLSLHRGYYYGLDNQEMFCPQAVMKIRLKDKPTTVKWTFRLLDALT